MGEKTHRHEIVRERGARKRIQWGEQHPRRVEMFFSGRIEQQRAEPRLPGNGREIAVAEMLTLNQARFVVDPHLKAALQRAVAEGLTDHRTPQAVQLPRQQCTGGLEVEDGTQRGIGAGKDNGVLRQPLQRGVFIKIKVLVQTGLRSAAAIELTGAGHGDERVAVGVQPDRYVQCIAAHNATWWVQQIEVAGFTFRIKRPLNG